MSTVARDLLTEPLWRGEDLGHPIPDSPHATSVCLPHWAHAVGYEEGDPGILERLDCGYPRFVFHRSVRELFARCGRGAQRDEACLVVPTATVARRLIDYLARRTGHAARCEEAEGLNAVFFAADLAGHAKAFWQHTGEIVSSRQAVAALEGVDDDPAAGAAAEDELRSRLAAIYGVESDDVFLFTNGMAAMAAAKRCVDAVGHGRPTAQLGFPYVDVLKVQEQFGGGAHLIPGSDATALARLRELAAAEPIAGCVVETPGNPLLSCPDLDALAAILRPIEAALVVDDTVGSPANIDVLPWADLVVGSLTKYVGGMGDVMGGSLVVNPASPLRHDLLAVLRAEHESLLWWQDAVVLAERSRDYVERLRRINTGADRVAAWLAQHPGIAEVHHPSLVDDGAYAKLRRPDGGNGGLLAFLPHEPATWSPKLYDHLRVSKGPSLGTNYTLACPYTILAHYRELDWAEAHGVSRWLIRVSIGLEDPDDLIARFASALEARSE